LFVVLLGFALFAQDAEAARRLGGGKSFGRQTMSRDQAPPARTPAQDAAAKPGQAQTAPATAPAPAGNRWMGPLTGLAAGLGIAALLSHFGLMGPFAAALGNILVIALLIFAGMFIWRMLKRSTSTAPANAPTMKQAFETPMAGRPMGSGATTNAYGVPVAGARPAAGAPAEVPADAAAGMAIPADFDVESFVRNAKVHFNRLQAAWDAKDMADIRKFTTPEVFAEIKMQRDEETASGARTEVDNLEATLLGIETTADDYVASVRFTGTIRENGEGPAPFEEVWNLVKPVDGRSGWLLGGIQQVH
jgi:predicted lipid-binding transport protein (Tim44 family)